MTTHFDTALSRWQDVNNNVLDFGCEMMHAVDTENRTIREMSVRLCGNNGLEDRIGRWVMAARWVRAIQYHPLYEDARQWLTPSHFTYYWKLYLKIDDEMETALDVMEQTFVRNVRNEIVEVRPVEWVRAHLGRDEVSYVDKVKRYANGITRDLIQTPFDGLSTREQMDAAADVRESAKALHENLTTLLALLLEAEKVTG